MSSPFGNSCIIIADKDTTFSTDNFHAIYEAGAVFFCVDDVTFYRLTADAESYETLNTASVEDLGTLGEGGGGAFPIATATGTVDALIADFTPDLTLADSVACIVQTLGTNTGAVTFTPDGLTTRAIVYNGTALTAGQMPKETLLKYDLTNTRWELLNPIASGGGGHTILNDGTPLTQRTGLNFVAPITATDDAVNDETEVSIDLSDYATHDEIDVGVVGGIIYLLNT